MKTRTAAAALAVCALVAIACKGGPAVDPASLAMFKPLPASMDSAGNPVTEAKVALGRALYYDARLSRDESRSCNSCHTLTMFGADTGGVSVGVGGKKGSRNAPTVFNAAGHVAQFWDGRARDVEQQALGPILNPAEMAMPDRAAVLRALTATPSYRPMFEAAFPGERNPVTIDNLGRAIGAFERRLVTPSRWDAYQRGADTALTAEELEGFNTFVAVGCSNCHNGAYVGGGQFQKAGVVAAWPDTNDAGRMSVTHETTDRMVFKVPSLRNIEHTAPYFHDGRVRSLDSAVVMMAHHQLGREITPRQLNQILDWLHALAGEIPLDYVVQPPPRHS